MKHLIIFILAVLSCSVVYGSSMRLSDSIPCKYLGSLFYGANVGYQLNFETESLNLHGHYGKGRLITVTIVVPRKGHSAGSLPEGTFTLGSRDSISINSLDYYGCGVFVYCDDGSYDKPDSCLAFRNCSLSIAKMKKGKYEVMIEYELNNGEKGEYSYIGKIKNRKKNARAKFNFMPEKPYIKNWQITEARIEVNTLTPFSSREALLTFACAEELYGTALIYIPLNDINGHYVIRYGKEPGSCAISTGGFDGYGFYNIFNTGMEEESSGYFFYPVSGYVDITEGKLFFEFKTRDGSTVRGYYYGEIKFYEGYSSRCNSIQ